MGNSNNVQISWGGLHLLFFFYQKNNDFEFKYADFGTLTNISVYFVTVMKIPMACNLIFLFRVSVTQSLSFLVLVLLSLVRLHMMFISFRYYRILSSLSRDKKLMVQHNIHMYVYLCYFIVVYVLFCGFFFFLLMFKQTWSTHVKVYNCY